jgi:hypothetical protein
MVRSNSTRPISSSEIEVSIPVHVAPGYAKGVVHIVTRPGRYVLQYSSLVQVNLGGTVLVVAYPDGKIQITITVHISPGHTGSVIASILREPAEYQVNRTIRTNKRGPKPENSK